MKFKDVKTIQHLLKEYATPVGQQSTGNTGIGSMAKTMAKGTGKSLSKKIGGGVGSAAKVAGNIIKGQDSKTTAKIKSIASPVASKAQQTLSPTVDGTAANKIQDPVVKAKAGEVEKGADIYDQYGNYAGRVDSPLGDNTAGSGPDAVAVLNKQNEFEVKKGDDEVFIQNPEMKEGKLSKIAKRKNKKLKIKNLKGKIKKLSRKRLKEAPAELFEINFNRKDVAKEGLDAPVKCGFEAESFFFNVSGYSSSSDDVDNMSVSDVEYEFGDLPDSAYEYYNEWIREKAMDEYLPDLIDQWIEDNRDEDYYIDEFMSSGDGPTMDAVEQYRDQMEEDDPQEFKNREADGWDDDNWARDFINLEYDYEYQDFLREYASEDDTLIDEAVEECNNDYSMDDYVESEYYSMSSFLDDFSYDYSRESEGNVEEVADELFNGWIKHYSKYDGYPDYGEYGNTYNIDGWSVETDSSIDADEGAAAEIISPVFPNPREMLKEMKSLFEWSEDNFGTNNSTGLHVTMSWNGEPRAGSKNVEPNKLKMALLLGDEYLLKQFGRLKNTYTKSQYRQLLKYAEKMKRGDNDSFLKLQSELERGISKDKFSSIHFKGSSDKDTDNELIEFRIAGGSDYNEMYQDVVKAVVRYGTIMKAGYDDNAFRRDYINAVSRLMRKSQEVDPERAKEFDEIDSPIVDAAKEIASKDEYFDVLNLLNYSLDAMKRYQDLSKPGADKEWEKSIDDYREGTGRDPSWMGEAVEEGEPIRGYIEPDRQAPSIRAENHFAKAKEYFGRAMAMLARQIVLGQARSTPKAKHIGAFRKYANELKLSMSDLEKLLLTSIDDARYGDLESDKEKHKTLQKGIQALFKKEIVGKAEFFDRRKFDAIEDGLWQFFQSDDVQDNQITDKLADLFVEVNPKNDKNQVVTTLRSLSKKRQKNELHRYLLNGGYDEATLIVPNMLTKHEAVDKLIKFFEPYQGYEHPTSKDHHVNVRSDDNYASVYQMNLMQKLRGRIRYIKDLEDEKKDTSALKKQLVKIGQEYIEALKPDDELELKQGDEGLGVVDGMDFLASDNRLTNWNNRLDVVVRLGGEIDDVGGQTYNFVPSYDDYVLSSMNLDRFFKRKQDYGIPKDNYLKSLIKNRFKATKKFLSAFDKLFQGQGFANLAKEIKGKNTIDKSNKDFEKNVRGSAKAKLNVPSHASVFFNEDFLETITDKDYGDREAYLDNHLDDFNDPANSNKVWVIPAAHYGQAEDALSGLELIGIFEKSDNYFHSWRKTGYNKILGKFARVHGIPFEDLTNSGKYVHGNSELNRLQNLGIEITRKGDSRAGMPGQDYLIEPEELENPISGEPINRGSAMMWDQFDEKEKEQKRFDAFDWSVYPEEMKELVAKEMKNESTFQFALKNILNKINDGEIKLALRRENNVAGMAQAAGVENLANASSNEVAGDTDWTKLADYLKIERGVNDQGVNLLLKVYNQYDSDHNWRPENPEAIGIERWAGAVKAAYEYIDKNYTVSAGNYFRKDADGKPGDDVSGVYGNDQSGFDVTTDDYQEMRNRYFNFNTMMMNGMQNYILQPDVNRLVAFLKNPDNDEEFKKAVLQSMMREREAGAEPNDFQGHLARGRMFMQSQNESVFDKFNKLPLQEQLKKIQEIDSNKINNVYEGRLKNAYMSGTLGDRFDQDFERVFNRPNPMKPKKPYNPQQHKEAVIQSKMRSQNISREQAELQLKMMLQREPDYFTAKKDAERQNKKQVKESVPNNTKVRMINKLLSDHFPASDLKKQMDAYFAIPDPQMLKDFRQRRAEAGDDVCLRPILRNYIQMKLHPKLHSSINLNESKEDLIAKLDALPDDEATKKLVNYIEQLIDDMGVGGKIQSLSNELEVIDDVDVKKAINQIAKIIASIEMSPAERAQLFVDWKADNIVNVDALLSTSTVKMKDIYKGYGEKGESHITELVNDFNQVVQYGIGPGEFALSVLSQRIEGIGASSGDDEGEGTKKGDLLIDGSPIELKTTRKNAARFNDRQVTISDSYKSLVTAFFKKYDEKFKELEQQGIKVRVKSGMQQNHVMAFLKEVPEAEKEVAEIISNIFTGLNVSGGPIARFLAQGDKNQAMQLIAQSNVNNYLTQKRQSGSLAGILFLDLNKQAFTFIKEVSDLEGTGLRLHAKTNYLITTEENPFANTSIVDTGV